MKTDDQYDFSKPSTQYKTDNKNRIISDDEFAEIFSNLDGFLPDTRAQPIAQPVPVPVPVQATVVSTKPYASTYTPPRTGILVFNLALDCFQVDF